jgi:hypothetical protein
MEIGVPRSLQLKDKVEVQVLESGGLINPIVKLVCCSAIG